MPPESQLSASTEPAWNKVESVTDSAAAFSAGDTGHFPSNKTSATPTQMTNSEPTS